MTQEEKINKLGYDLIDVECGSYWFAGKKYNESIMPCTPMFKTKKEVLNYLLIK